MTTQEMIDEFLLTKRFAMIGVSRNPKDLSRQLYTEFNRRGYDIVSVNPLSPEIEGKRCYARIQEVSPPVTSALIMVAGAASEKLVQECAEAGISLVWLYGVSGIKNVHPAAVERCAELGIKVITGYCPFMVLPNTSFVHRFHGVVWKMLGKYPQ